MKTTNYRLALMIAMTSVGLPTQSAAGTPTAVSAVTSPQDYTVAVYYWPNFHRDAYHQSKKGEGWTEWVEGSYIEPDTTNGIQEKSTLHRFEKLRAGAIQTAQGWNVQDFASSFFNPTAEEITVTMKMVSDDPQFVFANGQKGTFTKTYKIPPMQGETDNIYIGSPAFGKPEWPVAPLTNFTGTVEFSSPTPFYYYFLRETEVGEAPDATDAYFSAWKTWLDDVPVGWDEELMQFVIPYTNYWHNETSWRLGWHSVLTLKNNADHSVTYTLRHIPYYGGQFNPKDGQITRYKEQVVETVLQKGQEKQVTLQDLFGWAADQMSSMEGCLLVSPCPVEAKTQTAIRFSVSPNESGERLHDAIR